MFCGLRVSPARFAHHGAQFLRCSTGRHWYQWCSLANQLEQNIFADRTRRSRPPGEQYLQEIWRMITDGERNQFGAQTARVLGGDFLQRSG